MFYSTDCNYIVKIIGKDSHIECYTKEQLKSNIRHENGCIVYKVLNNGQLEKMAVIKPYKQKGYFKEVVKMSEVTIIFSDDDKKNLEKYMEMTRGGKWNIHDDFDIMDIMQVVLNDIDKKVNNR